MKRIAILGLGLMGGALGLALKARGAGTRVSGYARRRETRAQALDRGAVDEAHDDPAACVRDADFAVYCAPILSIPELVKASVPGFSRPCVLTDVGSTKSFLLETVGPILRGTSAVFVGSHPIAGSEQQGLGAARADLYEGAVVVVTPGDAPQAAVDRVRGFWEEMGAMVRTMSAGEHDRLMARTSHLPHATAALLAGAVGRDGRPDATGDFCGAGFRDTTRIAEGSPAVWHDILRSNRGYVVEELRVLAARVSAMADALHAGQYDAVAKMLEEGRERRRRLLESSGRDDRGGAA